MRTSLQAGGAPYAPAMWSAFDRAIDGYTSDWAAMRKTACEDTHVRGVQSAALLDVRMECLDRGRQDLDQLLSVLAQPGTSPVDQAVRAAYALPAVASCGDAAALAARSRIAPPADRLRPQVDELRAQIARLRALVLATRFDTALAMGPLVAQAAVAVDYPPAAGEAFEALADAQMNRRQLDDAAASYRRAYHSASVAGDDVTAGRSMISLARVVSLLQSKHPEGAELLREAAFIVERSGDRVLQADLLFMDSRLRYERGDFQGRASSSSARSWRANESSAPSIPRSPRRSTAAAP